MIIKLDQSEHEIQNLIESFLWMKGFYVLRLNSGQYQAYDIHGNKRMIKGQKAGTPDLEAIKDGRAYFIEVKRPGNKPTLLQKAKMEELREFGAVCMVATSIGDVEKGLNL